MLRASAIAEHLGIPAVSIVSDAFTGIARAIASAEGMPGHPLAVIPHVLMTESLDAIRHSARTDVVDQVVEGLGLDDGIVSSTPEMDSSRNPLEIVAQGSLDDVVEFFEERGWADGLPIIPPTRDRIEAFLSHTKRDPADEVGVLLPSHGRATPLNIAVNGVMAGCRPEYMPILIAVVEAMSAKEFRLEDGGSTPGWEPLVILSGPMIRRHGFNSGCGVMRTNRRPNASVGRFARLAMRNLAGIRSVPWSTDKGTIGMPTNSVLAEDEDAVRALGWKTFAEERGFRPDESVVTVQSVVSVSAPTYSGGTTPEEHAQTLVEVIGSHWAYKAWDSLYFGQYHPLLVMSPSVASVFASASWDKERIRQYFKDNLWVLAKDVQRYAWQASGIRLDIIEMARQGFIEPVYAQNEDEDRLVPALRPSAAIGIVLAGDPGRNQSRGYIQLHRQGVPTSRVVEKPG